MPERSPWQVWQAEKRKHLAALARRRKQDERYEKREIVAQAKHAAYCIAIRFVVGGNEYLLRCLKQWKSVLYRAHV